MTDQDPPEADTTSPEGEAPDKPKQKRPPKFIKLRACASFDEIHAKVVGGHSLTSLAKWIQNDKKEYTDVGLQSLVSVLKDYRASLPPAEKASVLLPKTVEKAVQELEKGIDALETMGWLIKLQQKRLEIGHKHEENMKILLPSMTQDVRALAEVTRGYNEIQMDLGIKNRHIGQVDVSAQILTAHVGNEQVAKTLSNTQSRRKILGAVSQFLDLAADSDTASAENAIEVEAVAASKAPPEGES